VRINYKNDIVTFFLSLAILCGILACATGNLEVKPIAISEDPLKQVTRLGNDLADAKQNKVNVLSPLWFSRVEKSYQEAKLSLVSEGGSSEVMKKVSLGDAQLKKAREKAEIARAALPDVIHARDLARNAGATNLAALYTEAEVRFLELTEAVEDGELSWAEKNKDSVIQAFRDLELKAIKLNTIGKVRDLIAQAEREEADERVPATLQAAKKQFKETDEYISKHRYEKEEMHKKANDALFQAQRLNQLNRQSAKIESMTPEQISLWMEDRMHGITKKLAAPDMRNETVDTQFENIIQSISALRKDHQFLIDRLKTQQDEMDEMYDRIVSLEGRTRQEQAEKEKLIEEKRFQTLYLEVQDLFELEEAEVYKQANQLIIRVRGIRFPVGSYALMPDNYELLSKVQRSIRIFGEPKVIIEGHTDSTGSDAVNERLSQQRADSVRQYFVANELLPADKIVSVGYGFSRPLESNKTEEGRAVNRRIDVIVIPER
jgi:OOP family OmpA-OmpF porin